MIGAIKTITARGFASFRDEVTLEFSEGINFISGLNHAGKSVVGLMLAEVLADVGPRSRKTIITDGEQEAVIEIKTYTNDEIYYSRGRDGSVYRSINGIEETSSAITDAIRETLDLLIVDRGTPSAPDHDLVNIRLSKDSMYFIGNQYGPTSQYQIIQQLTKTADLAEAEMNALKNATKVEKKIEFLTNELKSISSNYIEIDNKLKNQRSTDQIKKEQELINLKLKYIEKTNEIKSRLVKIENINLKLKQIVNVDKKLNYLKLVETIKLRLNAIDLKVSNLSLKKEVVEYIDKAFILGDKLQLLNTTIVELQVIQEIKTKLKGLDKVLLEKAQVCPYCGSKIGGDGCQQ